MNLILNEKLYINQVITNQIQFGHLIQKKINSFYREKDCIKRFCSELKELGTKVINYEQKEMTPLTDDENKSKKNATYVKKSFFIIKNNE